MESGAKGGRAIWSSSDNLVPEKISAQCTDYSMPIPAHGIAYIRLGQKKCLTLPSLEGLRFG
jgi:hypothetical protein